MKKLLASLAVMALPAVAFAQVNQPVTDFNSLTQKATGMGNTIIGILIAIAVIFIVFNALMFIIKASESADRAKYGYGIIWGAVGLAAILSIWGLVAIVTNTFGTTTGGSGPVNEYPVNPNPPVVH